MPTMCTSMARGWLLTRVEERMREPADRARLLVDLIDEKPLVDCLFAAGLLDKNVALERLMGSHLRKDWFTTGEGYWPWLPDDKEAIVRQGVITWLNSLNSLGEGAVGGVRWMCVGRQTDAELRRFECYVTEIERTSVLIILTPAVPYDANPLGTVATKAEPISAITSTEGKDRILWDTASFAPGSLPDADDPGVQQLDAAAGVWRVPVYD